MGQLIYNRTDVSKMDQKIDISDQPKGMYVVRLKVNDNYITQKIIKK